MAYFDTKLHKKAFQLKANRPLATGPGREGIPCGVVTGRGDPYGKGSRGPEGPIYFEIGPVRIFP